MPRGIKHEVLAGADRNRQLPTPGSVNTHQRQEKSMDMGATRWADKTHSIWVDLTQRSKERQDRVTGLA